MGFWDFFAPKASAPALPQPSDLVVRSARQDSWVNQQTGFGTARDKGRQTYYAAGCTLDDYTLEQLYYHDSIASVIVDVLVEEMFRKGWHIEEEAEDPYCDFLGFSDRLQETITWARAYGGALLVFGMNDGLPMDQPLNEARVTEVRWLQVLDRRYDVQVENYEDDTSSAEYLNPKLYRLGDPTTGRVFLVHASRCIHVDGTKVDRRKRIELKGWGYSVLQRPFEVMQSFANSFAAVGGLVVDASQGVFKIKDLEQKISHGAEDLQTRMALVEQSRSAIRAIMVDADKEGFERVATSFAGLPDVLDRFMQLLSAATRIPVSILMGRSPAGMNATGDSDWQGFYNYVERRQEKDLKPHLLRGYRLLSLAKNGPGAGVPFDGEICFTPLKQLTEKEEAELEKLVAEKDKICVDSGILYADEIAIARYGEGKFSTRAPEIDIASRKQALAKEIDLTLNPPPPPKVMVGAPKPPGMNAAPPPFPPKV